MSLVTRDYTNKLFGSSPAGQQLDLVEDLLANGFSDPYHGSPDEARRQTPRPQPDCLPVQLSPRKARRGSFDFIMDEALEQTPLGPKWSETSPIATPNPRMGSTMGV